MREAPHGYDELKDWCMNNPLDAAEFIAHQRQVIEGMTQIAAATGTHHHCADHLCPVPDCILSDPGLMPS